ncbi:hypothetical protein D9M71_413770 [compost metagenome]
MQADQQEVPVLGEPEHGLAAALGGIADALDLDGIHQAGLGAHAFLAQHTEVVGLDLVAVDHLVAHALLAVGDVMLEHQLVGGFVLHASVQGQAHLIAAVVADDLLLGPVEVELHLLALAQAAAVEAVGQRQEGVALDAEGAHLAQAGHQHGRFEVQFPAAIVQLLEAAAGGAADRQLFPVGGVAGLEGFQLGRDSGQGEKGEEQQQGTTHWRIS